MIYFMQATEGGPVKIGHSADVELTAQLVAVCERMLELLDAAEKLLDVIDDPYADITPHVAALRAVVERCKTEKF